MFDPVITPLVVTAAAGGFQAFQASQARKDAEREAKRTRREAEALSRQETRRIRRKERRAETQAVMRARKRRGVATTGDQDLRSTILTGPSGIAGAPAGAGKTLLGL